MIFERKFKKNLNLNLVLLLFEDCKIFIKSILLKIIKTKNNICHLFHKINYIN